MVTNSVVLLWISLVGAVFVSFIIQEQPLPDDFVPFYCASKVLVQGGNPYQAAPMAACNMDVWKDNWRATRWITPAPLPPLALAALSPVSRIPFNIAVRVWRILILLSAVASALLLSRMRKAPFIVLLSLFVPIGIIENGYNGQPVSVVLLFLIGAAYALKWNKYSLAAVLAACSLVEPHLGLPACLALFIYVPRIRPWLASALGVIAVFSLLILPPHLTWEYAFSVLPHHARAESTWYQQYSLTYALTFFGMSPQLALLLGTVWYCGAIAVGTFIAARIARRISAAETLVFIPVAFAVFGGAYIHVFQMIAALPAATLFIESEDESVASLARIALLLISIPWMKAWIPGMAFIILLLGIALFQVDRVRASYVVTGFALAMLFPLLYFNVRPVATIPITSVYFSAKDPLEAPYEQYIALAKPNSSVVNGMFLAKCPTWCGLALLTFVTFRRRVAKARLTELKPSVPSK